MDAEGIISGKGGIKSYILDLFFPNRCPFCGSFIPYDRLCCEKCFHEALWADENICPLCGKSLLKGCICGDGLRYDMCFAAAYYTDNVRECIHALKFHGNVNGAEIFGRVLGEKLKISGAADEIDIALPVPMTAKQKRERGYNQAELIARAAVSGTDIEVNTSLLTRKNVKISQHLLSAEERRKAVGEQYSAAEGADLEGKNVLLVDDVLTTGSTLNCCAGILKDRLHAKKVICAAAATV